MMNLLKQSTSVTIRFGPFMGLDGINEETGLTPGIEVSKNHGTFAARSGSSVAHDAEGWYGVELNATDTNTLGPLLVKAHDAANHLPVWREFLVVPANVYDSLVAGSDKLQVDTVEISGDSGAADNLETAADGGSYNLGGGGIVAASVTGAVGSVTGAVASVTGNVGGNVAGSVASVTGNVGGNVAGSVASVTGNVGGNVAGSVASVTGAVGSVTAPVTAGTVSDKTGYRLSSTGVDDILDETVEGSLTLRHCVRLLVAWAAGKVSGGGTTSIAFRDQADSKNRIVQTVDANGDRSAVSVDGT